jgi:hypothetical protein
MQDQVPLEVPLAAMAEPTGMAVPLSFDRPERPGYPYDALTLGVGLWLHRPSE